MRLAKFAIAGAMMLALVACHEPGHDWCDWDDDGDTDGADYLIIQQQLGGTLAITAADVVPEPPALTLAAVGLAALCRTTSGRRIRSGRRSTPGGLTG